MFRITVVSLDGITTTINLQLYFLKHFYHDRLQDDLLLHSKDITLWQITPNVQISNQDKHFNRNPEEKGEGTEITYSILRAFSATIFSGKAARHSYTVFRCCVAQNKISVCFGYRFLTQFSVKKMLGSTWQKKINTTQYSKTSI